MVCASERLAPAERVPREDCREVAAEMEAAEQGAGSRYRGPLLALVTTLLVGMSLVHVWAGIDRPEPRFLRPLHVGFILILVFLMFPVSGAGSRRPGWPDIVCMLLGVATIAYLFAAGEAFWSRSASPRASDVFFGVVFIVLVVEACRRASGWPTSLVVVAFLALPFAGPWLPGPLHSDGADIAVMTGYLFQTLDGVFGDAVAASSGLLILFTIFGAFLRQSGAVAYFREWSVAAMAGRRTSAARSVLLSSLLAGSGSGSASATTVANGPLASPLLVRGGYSNEAAGGLLAAAGAGSSLTPPVLGAAAFVLAEFLEIEYADILLMTTIPAVLYYLTLWGMAEIDTRQFGVREVTATGADRGPGALTRRHWYHFGSLVSVIVLMALGVPTVLSVLCAVAFTYLASFIHRDTAMGIRKLVVALKDGSGQLLNVAATCAAAGVVVGVVAKTELAMKFSAIVIDYAGGSLALTALYTALIVRVVGLAVPVTASYIICAVIVAPALTKLGVPDFAAHLFIFYYAVLSGVSPPIALSPFAAAAITGGDPYMTTLQSWKYTLPAFVVPFVFVLDPAGIALLLKVPPESSWVHVVWIALTAVVGIAALACGVQKWLLRGCGQFGRWLLIACGLLLVYPAPATDWIGLGGLAAVLAWQRFGGRRHAA